MSDGGNNRRALAFTPGPTHPASPTCLRSPRSASVAPSSVVIGAVFSHLDPPAPVRIVLLVSVCRWRRLRIPTHIPCRRGGAVGRRRWWVMGASEHVDEC